jgi:hypothetical protein
MPDAPDQDFRPQMAGIYPSASSSARSNEPTSAVDWLRNGTGRSPSLRWSYQTEAPLVTLQLARETGELLVVDASGSLYVLDPDGKLLAMGQGRAAVSNAVWSDTGAGGVAAVDRKLVWFDRRLRIGDTKELPRPVCGMAMEAHGHFVAVSTEDCFTAIFDENGKRSQRFETIQPLTFIDFFIESPGLVGAGEYDVFLCRDFAGGLLWQEKLWSNVGDMCVSGDGRAILLAAFNHGLQRYDRHGKNIGSYQIGQTVCRVATDYAVRRVAAASMEGEFFWLDSTGGIIWQSKPASEVKRIACDPLGTGCVVGLQSGRIERLEWGGV